MSDDKKITTDKKQSFGLSFGTNGSVSITTDCNNGTAVFSVEETKLRLGPVASTKKYCEGSQETEFFKQLDQVESFLMKDSNLYLQLKLDSGTMTFIKTR
jgi:heat shock protein HslJ